ncbi:hypothetical protein [Streptomyces sp. NPDC052042]|uniref:hypothetical protein n=1 Tax=Streptomyces sp. NPDC052042 TaxID=3365683 RepID=UPI0037D8D888
MRPARPVTGAATVAVSIAAPAALGLLAAGGPAYADTTGATARSGPVAATSVGGVPGEQGGGDGPAGTGHNTPLGGVNVPSLLDSVGGLNAVPGLGTTARNEGSNDRGDRNSNGDGGSSGRDDASSGRDGSSSGPEGPRGHVKTGVGGSVRSDTTQIAAGAGVVAGAAAGGAWLLRRRASGTQGAG